LKGLALEWASGPDSSYGAILFLVAVGAAWSRRRRVSAAAAEATHTAWGAAALAAGLAMYLVGFLGADVFVTRISFVFVLAGAIWTVAGVRALRVLAAPLFFLMLAVPLPALVVNAITLPLQLVASRLAESMLGFAQIPVFRDGNVLELRSTSLEVAEACSGLRSAISLTAMACLLAWANDRFLGRRLVLVAIAVPLAIFLNGIRIAATGIACEMWGPAAASGRWHEFAGWLTFVVGMIVLVQTQRLAPRFSRSAHAVMRTEAASA
jgi:exosortase